MRTAALLFALCCAGELAAQPPTLTNTTVFRRVFTAIAAPATSANLPNIGQVTHLLTVIFPTAAADVTSGLQIRIEASYDNVLFFPISRDITTASFSGTSAIAVERANASYPFLRVRAVAVPATPALTAHYTGTMQPLGNVLVSAGRIIAASPTAGDKVTWGLCVGAPCTTGTNLTVPWIATAALNFEKCFIASKTAPTGAALIVDILKNGTTAFTATKLQLAAGALTGTLSTFAAASAMAEGDQLSINIDQVGSVIAGQDISVVCRLR